VEIRELGLGGLDDAAALLSRGMRDNPLHVAAFGDDPAQRERALARFFAPALRGLHERGTILGCFGDGALLGVCGMAPPGGCQPGAIGKLRVVPGLIGPDGLQVPLRVLSWVHAWARRDPREAHWHLGPVAVDAHLQGKGIGSALLAAFCSRMDEIGALAYLETDKRENVRFYGRAGFELTDQADVLGLPNWFMTRPARSAGGARS
jgi:GNAT superfamily N-acetyltransferase